VSLPDTYAITARDVGIKYDLRLTPDRTLRRTASEIVRARKISADSAFWALRDVSFDVRHGEILGVIGANGSGKSTLLLAIAGILRPDRGVIYTSASAPTLLTLGVGFEGDLTGRQNIFLNAAYLGFSREKMRGRMQDIVEFAELGDFIDAPLRTYSSGMRLRLAFAVAVHVEPEILLLDEVLSVGDEAFQRKSRAKLLELMERARAIVVVTHNLSFVKETCNRALWLANGRVAGHGDAGSTVDRYHAALHESPPLGVATS
jgi:ABC-type polysaccharide/polyol phosphate transport system ATPase subunit